MKCEVSHYILPPTAVDPPTEFANWGKCKNTSAHAPNYHNNSPHYLGVADPIPDLPRPDASPCKIRRLEPMDIVFRSPRPANNRIGEVLGAGSL